MFLPEVDGEVVPTREALVADVALVAGLRVTLKGREGDVTAPRASREGGIGFPDADTRRHRS